MNRTKATSHAAAVRQHGRDPAVVELRARPRPAAGAFALPARRPGPPALEPGTVLRPALVHRLGASHGTTVVVTAPAGYGKTTLLAEWARHDRRPFAWVTAGEADNDPVRLLGSLAAALEHAGARCSALSESLVEGAPLSDSTALLKAALSTLEGELVVVVDSADLLTRARCRGVLTAVVDGLGPGSRLVVAGRTQPLLPVPWLRSHGGVFELGADELGLTDGEAGALLRAAGVVLPEGEVSELNRHAQGWPTGLRLAALSMLRQRTDGGGAALRFDGADRFVSDYFSLELFSRLPAPETDFLRHVSVLDHLCAPLCDATLGRSGSREMLASLERSNLFLSSEPDPGCGIAPRCYRLHPMLRDTLSSELERRKPELVKSLQDRASKWSEAHARLAGAVRYAHASGDHDRVVSLLETWAPRTFGAAETADFERWLERAERSRPLDDRPEVAMLGARLHAVCGHPEAAERLADIADRALDEAHLAPAPWILVTRAGLCRDGLERMRGDAGLAARATVPGEPWHASALVLLAVAELLLGDPETADTLFDQAVEASSEAAPDVTALALAGRSLVAGARGHWPAAAALAREARAIVVDSGLAGYVMASLVHAAGARAAQRTGDLQRAAEALEEAQGLLPQVTYALPWLSAQVRLELARIRLARSEPAAAALLLDELSDLLLHRPALGVVAVQLGELREQLDAVDGLSGGRAASLTQAERRLLPLLTTHLTFQEIATELGISRNTVKTQAISVYRKLGVTCRDEAVVAASGLGLMSASTQPGALGAAAGPAD